MTPLESDMTKTDKHVQISGGGNTVWVHTDIGSSWRVRAALLVVSVVAVLLGSGTAILFGIQ